MKTAPFAFLTAVALLLSACGGEAAPVTARASAKPAASSAASASAAAKPAPSGAVGPQASSVEIPPSKPGSINLALVGGSPSATPLYLALENKLFDKYN